MAVQAVAGLDAIGAVIDAGASPPAVLANPRFYRDGEVPPSAPLAYFLLGQVLEDPSGFYNAPGSDNLYWVHCWADTYTNALRLFAWLHDLLHDQPIAVTGHGIWMCKVRLIGKGQDATSTAQQATTQVEMRSIAA